ncbi:hypothetical protein HC928_15670, partial [bacterium]|nr:hypothetical protein [bacterium]
MNLQDFLNNLNEFNFQLSEDTRRVLIFLAIRFSILIVCIFMSIGIGRFIPWSIEFILKRVPLSEARKKEYRSIVDSVKYPLSIAVKLILISVSLNIIASYTGIYSVASFIVDAAVTIAIAWTASCAIKRLIHLY